LKTFQHPPTQKLAGKHCQQKEDTDKQKQPKLAESINQSQRKTATQPQGPCRRGKNATNNTTPKEATLLDASKNWH